MLGVFILPETVNIFIVCNIKIWYNKHEKTLKFQHLLKLTQNYVIILLDMSHTFFLFSRDLKRRYMGVTNIGKSLG